MKTTRREVLASAALVPVAALTSSAQQASQGALTTEQLTTLQAFVDRLIPEDELGPGAVAAGAHNYINIQLAGYLSGEKAAFATGLDEMDAYARRAAASPFAGLPAAKRDEIMIAMDTGKADGFVNARNFFTRARRLTLEGTFGDPHYGGNNNGIGWDIIRYPGPRPAVDADMQRSATPAAPYRKSAWGNADHDH